MRKRASHSNTLPRDEFPTLVELADDLTADDQDGLFQFGIDLLLRRLESLPRRR